MIVQLSEETIAKISSGETISSLVCIVKEMLENSLDAKANEILVKLANNLTFSIEDNGTGIKEEDFSLLCARYCTSKLKSSDDLSSINTYGFRGEALASISLCSKLSVKSGNFECFYENGELKNKKRIPFQKGSSFFVNDIFYNNLHRKEYFLKRREELRKIIDILFNYKIVSDVKLNVILNNKQVDKFCLDSLEMIDKCKALQMFYSLEHPLLFNHNQNFLIIFSPPAVHLSKPIINLFLNKRMIQNKRLKNELINVYKSILPINKFPFIFLEIKLPQNEIDVNIHPSKKEALFDENFVIKETIKMIKDGLNESIISIPSINKENLTNLGQVMTIYKNKGIEESKKSQKIYENEQNTLFFKKYDRKREFNLKSIQELKEEILKNESKINKNNFVYVGKEGNDCYCQFDDKLLKFDIKTVLKFFFKQIFTVEFGDFDKISTNFSLKEKIDKNKEEFLNYYFLVKISNQKITESFSKFDIFLNELHLNEFISLINTIEFDEEIKVFHLLINKLSDLFVNSCTMNESFFNILKSKIIFTKEILDCFYEVITVNKLFKLFERT